MSRVARLTLWTVLASGAALVSWCYNHRILLPWEQYVTIKHGLVKAQMGDLYPPWVGTRELLLNGKNPYGPDVSHQIQMGFYGHPIGQGYDKPDSRIVNEQRFAYPVYVVFLLAATVNMDFQQVQIVAALVLGLMTALSVWLWSSILGWRLSRILGGVIVLLVLSSPQVAQGLHMRQLALFVAFVIALGTWCVRRERYFIAGLLFAVATIKPQMVLLCLAWFLIWTLGQWGKRWTLAAGFGAGLGALGGAGALLLPEWPNYFLQGISAYRQYNSMISPLGLVLGNEIGGAVSVLVVVAVIAYAWRERRMTVDSKEFGQTLALFLMVSGLALPLLTPYNQVLLLLPLLVLLRDWPTLPQWSRVSFSLLVAWPWIVQALTLLRRPEVQSMSRLPLLPSVLVLLFPFVIPVLMFLRQESPAQIVQS